MGSFFGKVPLRPDTGKFSTAKPAEVGIDKTFVIGVLPKTNGAAWKRNSANQLAFAEHYHASNFITPGNTSHRKNPHLRLYLMKKD